MSDHTPLSDPPHITQESDASLREMRVASALMHQGKFLTLKQDIMRLPGGRSTSCEYLVHPDAVTMIPLFDDGTALMERQFRYPVDRVVIEFPAGKLDPQGGTLTCDKRELCEETGCTAEHWDYPTRTHPVISYSTEFINICLARDLR